MKSISAQVENSNPASENELPNKRLAYSVPEAAVISGLGRTTLYKLMGLGRLAAVKLGRRTLIRHDDLDALLSSSAEAH